MNWVHETRSVLTTIVLFVRMMAHPTTLEKDQKINGRLVGLANSTIS